MLLTAAGLLAVTSVGAATPATATRLASPQAHAANFPQSITVGVPAGGDATITSSVLPPQTTQATVVLAPVGGETADSLKQLTTVLAAEPSKAKRVLTCVFIYAALRGLLPEFSLDDDFVDPVLGALLLHACVEIAVSIGANPATGARASLASMCSRRDKSVPLKLTHTAAGYHAHLQGRTHKPSGRSPLITSCQLTPAGLTLTIRPRSSHTTLPALVGPNLAIGLLSPSTSSSPLSVRATISVR